MGRDRASRAAADGLAALALLALPWLLYGGALGLWWTEDDFFQLRFASRYAPADYTFDPAVARLLPNRYLTPLLFASYDVDLGLGGLRPEVFYGHQLLSLGLAAAALFVTLRLWVPPAWAFLGGATFLLGPPIASLAPLLMVRHYPEALLLALVGAWTFGLALRRRRASAWCLTGLSALLYLGASLAKEIAVPLPAVLAFLPEGKPRRRLALLAPHLAVLGVYVVYRLWMIGSPFGSYGWSISPGDVVWLALRLPVRIARQLAGPSPWGWVALTGVVAAVLALCLRNRRAAALVAAGLFSALLPVLPVAHEVTPRFAATTWLLLTAASVPAARRLAPEVRGPPGRGVRRWTWLSLGLVLVLGAALAANRQAWREHHGRAARMSAENLGFLELEAGELLRQPAGPPASMAELRRFARALLDLPAKGDWFYDDLFLCERRRPVRAVWSFDRAAGRLEDVTGELPELRRRYCGSIRWDAPLEATFHRRDGVLTWELGPHPPGEGGGYAFLLEDGRYRYDVPGDGAFHIGDQPLAGLRVRYASPEGWVTYSPPLDLDPAASLRWSR